MSEEFTIYIVISMVCLVIGIAGGFKLGYAYGMRVSQGFNLVEWTKSLLPFGKIL